MSARKMRAARISIYSNTSLVLLKLVVGLASGSVSVLSEAAHSGSDLVASFIAFFSVRVSARPADPKHPYGHGKAESLSGLAEALLIFGAAGYIIVEAVNKIRHGGEVQHLGLGMAVMLFSSVINLFVARMLFRVARDTDSLALEADGEHLRTDVYTSAGVMLGLALVWVTRWPLLDPIVAIAVAGLICNAAWRLTRDALEPLMDARLPEEDTAAVRLALESAPDVVSYHKLRTRKSGAMRYVDVHVQVDDSMTLAHAHALTERLEDAVRATLPNAEVTIHTEPYEAEMLHQMTEHGGPPADHRRVQDVDSSSEPGS